jgi:hypothetical protein
MTESLLGPQQLAPAPGVQQLAWLPARTDWAAAPYLARTVSRTASGVWVAVIIVVSFGKRRTVVIR